MIVGDPTVFAIHSGISKAYERLSLRALGFFVIRVLGRSYGLPLPESTMLACSFDSVERRVGDRGRHLAPFADDPDAGKIADTVRGALYAEDRGGSVYFGLSQMEFSDLVYSRHLIWAPDGDEAFDDGSMVLQFDVNDGVRLIAFRRGEGYFHDPTTLSDLRLPADEFYRVLREWKEAFEVEWKSMPRVPGPGHGAVGAGMV